MKIMSNKLTYVEARDKIWNAYFRDEIKPLEVDFCFCGTLAGGDVWEDGLCPLYARQEYGIMEKALFSAWSEIIWIDNADISVKDNRLDTIDIVNKELPDYEDKIFSGMLSALEVLKQIHRERGEVIPEDEPLLKKRNLVTI